MKNIYKIIFSMSLLMFLLSGCGSLSYTNGVHTPTKEDVLKRKQYKVYFDESATIAREKIVMKKTIEIFNKGIDSIATFRRVELESEPNINFARTTNIYDMDTKYYDYAISEMSDADTIRLSEYVKVHEDKNAKQIKINLIEKERKLVVGNNYTSHIELFLDVLKIGHAFKDKAFIELKKEYGFSKFIVDGKEFIENKKIVLVPITAHYSFKKKIESQLNTKGFTVVQNKEDANEIIWLETLAYMKGKYLKEFKNNSQLASIKRDAQTPQLAMDFNDFAGGSSGGSAAIGGVLFLMNFLGDDLKEAYHYILTARKIHEDKVKFVSFKPLKYTSLTGIHLNYEYIDRKDKLDGFNHISQGMTRFIIKGRTLSSKDKNITLE